MRENPWAIAGLSRGRDTRADGGSRTWDSDSNTAEKTKDL